MGHENELDKFPVSDGDKNHKDGVVEEDDIMGHYLKGLVVDDKKGITSEDFNISDADEDGLGEENKEEENPSISAGDYLEGFVAKNKKGATSEDFGIEEEESDGLEK